MEATGRQDAGVRGRDVVTLRVGSLFTGIGGLDLGLVRAFDGSGFDLEHVWMAELAPERIPSPAEDATPYQLAEYRREVRQAELRRAVLGLRFGAGLEGGPVLYPDVAECVVAAPVDIVVGGFPCQDISLAGKGAGLEGEKSGLWFTMLDVIRHTMPSVVLAENVAALQRRGLRVVVQGLVELGYDVHVTRIQAADAGAPHKRERLLILATRGAGARWVAKVGTWTKVGDGAGMLNSVTGEPVPRWLSATVREPWNTPVARDGSGNGPKVLDGRRGELVSQQVRGSDWPTAIKADSKAAASSGARGNPSLSAAVREPEGTHYPTPISRDWKSPSRASKDNARPLSEHVPGPLNPAWVEALMGLPIGWTDVTCPDEHLFHPSGWVMGQGPEQHEWEPPRMQLGVDDRTSRIACLGNGVVPAIVTLALRGRRGGGDVE